MREAEGSWSAPAPDADETRVDTPPAATPPPAGTMPWTMLGADAGAACVDGVCALPDP